MVSFRKICMAILPLLCVAAVGDEVEPLYSKHDYIKGSVMILTNTEAYVAGRLYSVSGEIAEINEKIAHLPSEEKIAEVALAATNYTDALETKLTNGSITVSKATNAMNAEQAGVASGLEGTSTTRTGQEIFNAIDTAASKEYVNSIGSTISSDATNYTDNVAEQTKTWVQGLGYATQSDLLGTASALQTSIDEVAATVSKIPIMTTNDVCNIVTNRTEGSWSDWEWSDGIDHGQPVYDNILYVDHGGWVLQNPVPDSFNEEEAHGQIEWNIDDENISTLIFTGATLRVYTIVRKWVSGKNVLGLAMMSDIPSTNDFATLSITNGLASEVYVDVSVENAIQDAETNRTSLAVGSGAYSGTNSIAAGTKSRYGYSYAGDITLADINGLIVSNLQNRTAYTIIGSGGWITNQVDTNSYPLYVTTGSAVMWNSDGRWNALTDRSLAIGDGSIAFSGGMAQGNQSVAIGGAISTGYRSFAAGGTHTQAIGEYSHAEGDAATSLGQSSHAEGSYTTANGNSSHAEGGRTVSAGNWSHAEGWSTSASNTYSHSEGKYTRAKGLASHAEGSETEASGECSHSEGQRSVASSGYSHAEGRDTEASGMYAHAEGINSKAKGYGSHAEGYGTTTSSNYSHAEGAGTTASGESSHAEGRYSTSSGVASHVMGTSSQTSASATNSFAGGNMATASGYNTFIWNGETSRRTASSNGDFYIYSQHGVEGVFIGGASASASNMLSIIRHEVDVSTSNFVTESITNDLVTASITNGLVTASITNGLVTADITNGLVTASITNGLVTASITNGLVTASITNGLVTASVTNGLVTSSVTNGLAGRDMISQDNPDFARAVTNLPIAVLNDEGKVPPDMLPPIEAGLKTNNVEDLIDENISTNNPSFVAAVTNCPVVTDPEYGDFAGYGTIGALLAALVAAIALLRKKKADEETLADEFATDKTYVKDEYVTYNGRLYRFNSDHSAGAWTGSDADEIQVTAPDATVDIGSDSRLRVVDAEANILWSQGYRLADESSVTLSCDKVNLISIANGTTTLSLALPTVPTGVTGDFIVNVDNSQNASNVACEIADLTDMKISVVVMDLDDLNDLLTFEANTMYELYFTQTAFEIDGKPTWKLMRQVVVSGNPSVGG